MNSLDVKQLQTARSDRISPMPAALPPFVESLGDGIHVVDTGFQRERFDAAYLIVERGRAAFVDTGTNFGVPRLLAALEALGLERGAVDYVIATHVHLDHAGGVGLLMQELPAARLVVHARGARHLVDPTVLYQGALAVYGQAEMDRSYGRLVPVAADRVVATQDGSTIELAGRPLAFADTPGHARHHHCIWDAASGTWFTGDTLGLSYRDFDTARGAWLIPTTTPVQFEPDLMRQSVERLLAAGPRWACLTHFGRIGDVPQAAATMLGLLDRVVSLGHALRSAPQRHQRLCEGLLDLYAESLADHGCPLPRPRIQELLGLDIDINAQGMEVWLDRR